MTEVKLTAQEWSMGGCFAIWRLTMAWVTGQRHKIGREPSCDELIASVNAEQAVAKALGQRWTGVEGVGAADVGEHVEVRWTNKRGNWGLWLRPWDVPKADRIWVLVTGGTPEAMEVFQLHGWVWGADFMVDGNEYWVECGKKSAWKVPPERLTPWEAWPIDEGRYVSDRRAGTRRVEEEVPVA